MTARRTKENWKWILASASPRRKEILQQLGISFLADPSTKPEPQRLAHESPSRYAMRAAIMKAGEVAQRHSDGFILAADTIVVIDDTVLGKPSDRGDALRMLRQLNGRWHEVVTGLCLVDARWRLDFSLCSRSRVHFRRMTLKEIDWYLDTHEYRDKAGAYGVQGYASLFIDRIEGCYFNIVGFPVAAFERLCRKAGFPLISAIKMPSI